MPTIQEDDALAAQLDDPVDLTKQAGDVSDEHVDAPSTEPSEPVASAPVGPSRGRRLLGWLRGHRLAVGAALLIVALAVGLVLTTLSLRQSRALDEARGSALQAGKDSAVALASYDYRSLDKDFGAVTSRSTPGFRDSFTQTSAALQKVLQQYNATAKSTIVAAGVTSATTDRAVVLVFLNQVATNTNQKAGPTTDQSRVEITLVRPDGTWLIDAVKLL